MKCSSPGTILGPGLWCVLEESTDDVLGTQNIKEQLAEGWGPSTHWPEDVQKEGGGRHSLWSQHELRYEVGQGKEEVGAADNRSYGCCCGIWALSDLMKDTRVNVEEDVKGEQRRPEEETEDDTQDVSLVELGGFRCLLNERWWDRSWGLSGRPMRHHPEDPQSDAFFSSFSIDIWFPTDDHKTFVLVILRNMAP